MGDLTTINFNMTKANQFISSIGNTEYYIFAGHCTPWPNDLAPPTPASSQQTVVFDTWDTMIFGKQLYANNVYLMAARYDWTANTIYTAYDDQNVNLITSPFYVGVNANTSYDVFKCLNNNNGIPSTVTPSRAATSESDGFYFTSDGYHWKYLYSVPMTTFNVYATNNYIPYIPNANTSGNSIPGAIDSIIVSYSGSQYNSYYDGTFTAISVGGNPLLHSISTTAAANNSFYNGCAIKITSGTGAGQQKTITNYIVSGLTKNVVVDSPFGTLPDFTSTFEISPLVVLAGSGTGFQGRAIINSTSNTVSSIEIVNRGSGYYWATATIQANTGLINIVTNTSIIANNAIIRPIISPSFGHGGNIPYELGMYNVGISVNFANTESNTIPIANQFRSVGIIQNPLFANVVFTIANTTGSFSNGEVITQANTGATALITITNNPSSITVTNATSNFVSGNNLIVGASSNATAKISSFMNNGESKAFSTFDMRTKLGITLNGVTPYILNEVVSQNTTQAVVNDANSSFVNIVSTRGNFAATGLSNYTLVGANSGATANIVSITPPDVVINSGTVLYKDFIQPIQRSANTTETITMVIGF